MYILLTNVTSVNLIFFKCRNRLNQPEKNALVSTHPTLCCFSCSPQFETPKLGKGQHQLAGFTDEGNEAKE